MWKYLEESGIDLSDEAQVAEAKKAYRKQYKREHTRQRRRTHPEVIVRLNLQEWLSLQRLANEYDKPLATTIKLCYLAFLQGYRELPRRKSTEPLKQMLRIIQSDLRMLSKHIRQMEYQELSQVVIGLQERCQRLEDTFSLYMQAPYKPK